MRRIPEESEDENNGALEQSLVEEWDTEDVVFWLETNGLHSFTQGFKDQKIDGMCLKEGLSDDDLVCCNVHTVGEKRLLQRKLSELVGHSKPKVPKLTKRALSTKALSPQQKEELLRRRRQVHRKTVKMFPGNKIPIIRGNVVAKRQFEDLVQSCKDLLKSDIGYDEDELRRHIRAIMDERRRMVREGYSYADEGETSSTDDSAVKAREKNVCGEEGSDGDHSLEASQSKTNARHGKRKRSSYGENACEQYIRGEKGSDGDHSFEASQNKTNGSQGGKGKKRSPSDEKSAEENISDEEGSDEDELQLPGGATTVPLSTAETILLAFFKKGYTKDIKKEEHLNPLCREMKIKNFKGKDKAELIIILAKELLLKKRVVLKKDADFYCLHKESISIK